MEAGPLRRFVRIESPGGTRDAMGTKNPAWDLVAEVWAQLKPLTGRELWLARQTSARVTHAIRMRYREGVTTQMRILYQGRAFEIESCVDDEERHEFLEIHAVEIPRGSA